MLLIAKGLIYAEILDIFETHNDYMFCCLEIKVRSDITHKYLPNLFHLVRKCDKFAKRLKFDLYII